ncbi:MAG: hypothetical protein ACLFVU_11970 [Phycisphaerae bacterium]
MILLQTNQPDYVGIVIWGTVLILILVAASIFIAWLRRRWQYAQDVRESAGFDMEELQRLREKGELSPEEFRVLRRTVLGLDLDGQEGNNEGLNAGDDQDDSNEAETREE